MPNSKKQIKCTCSTCEAIKQLKEFNTATQIQNDLLFTIELAFQNSDVKTGAISPAQIIDCMSHVRNITQILKSV